MKTNALAFSKYDNVIVKKYNRLAISEFINWRFLYPNEVELLFPVSLTFIRVSSLYIPVRVLTVEYKVTSFENTTHYMSAPPTLYQILIIFP